MITIITISVAGTELALRIKEKLPDSEVFTLQKYATDQTIAFASDLTTLVGDLFVSRKTLVFIMATGIVVRSLAPFIVHKATDPAVVVLDEKGTFAISLLSGHLGGANEIASQLASLLGSIPVITTASDLHGKLSVDMFAQQNNLIISSLDDAKLVTSLLIINKSIGQQNDTLVSLPLIYTAVKQLDAFVLITTKKRVESDMPYARLLTKNIVLGIGCRKGILGDDIISFVEQQLDVCNIDTRCVSAVASVDVKSDEPGIHQLAHHFGIMPIFVSRSEILKVENKFSASSFVQQQIGVSCVCEPAAYIVGGQEGRFLLHKSSQNGITLAIFEKLQ